MAILVILAIGVAVPAAAAALAQRDRLLRRFIAIRCADIRGIALQTVIIIVVMLGIAGGVAGVLVSRGQEVTGQLEATSVGPVDAASCPALSIGTVAGVALASTTGSADGAGTDYCAWESAANASISSSQCRIFGGVHYDVPGTVVAATIDGIAMEVADLAANTEICVANL